MRAFSSTFISLGLAVLAAASDEDVISFPAIGEVDIVFPREDTYAGEAPFPVIFGLQNAPVLTTFSGTLNWELNSIADADEGDQFQYWRSEEDSCILKWDLRWTTVCEPRKDGSLLLKNNQFERSSNVTFTLRPGAKTARKAIAEYDGCAIGGTAVKVERNHTVGCPILAEDASSKPQPCGLDVKKARSSLAEAVVKPTTSLTVLPSKTTDAGVDALGTGTDGASVPSSTGDTSGQSSGSGKDDNGAQRLGSSNVRFLTLFTALVTSILLELVM
ncbi:uncharacterized protein FTJAE_7838 [Fusarium tjaetaba]|uniref:DUF7136 domain-containing protein n=1 Tax=Fusarium tjaetaba TaxID=1567544 RepID=A0A8H5VNN3_9HYPO|nr:uncharacterized protein FTJAE_7838 [Fusarium tjaetaba]KAF5631637.1 hypothetical protein FTJAE_7838 [Fusarium tjaetaba]